MLHTQTCDHCRTEIPLFAWICPHCDTWVGEINRHEVPGTRDGRIAG